MADFQALCHELVKAMDGYPLRPKAHRDLCNQVRFALKKAKEKAAQPKQQFNYQASEAHWLDIEEWVKASSQASTDHCILELRDRVKTLEKTMSEQNQLISQTCRKIKGNH
jgi:hypothetical protein